MISPADTDVVVRRWLDVASGVRDTDALDRIFFEASATQSFADEEIRSAFKERWLGRYLVHDPDWFYVAVADNGDGRLVGYLAGAVDDPACAKRFSDIGYLGELADVTARYPAHFHVNVASDRRSGGIGARLISAFVADLRRAGVPGVHLVTGAASRNVSFYERNGFEELRRISRGDRELVMLGKLIAGRPAR